MTDRDRIIKPPTPLPDRITFLPSVFLAGSIEMGAAEDWQERAGQAVLAMAPDILVLNPRRDDWDSSWHQSIENPRFREQVEWELTAMETSSWILMHFCPENRSPITLLELGLWARSPRLIVSCPDGFWRRGNVEIVCRRYRADFTEGLDEALHMLKCHITTEIELERAHRRAQTTQYSPLDEVHRWNARHPVGTTVRYYPVADRPDYIETTTASIAAVRGGSTAVVFVEARRKCVALRNLKPIETAR